MAPTQPAFVAKKKKASASAANKEKKNSSSPSSRSRAVRASSTTTATTKNTKPTRNKSSKKKKRQQQTTTLSPLTERHERLTAEEEVELARIIRQGTELQRLKAAFEAEHGRDITRQEWTDLAMTESAAADIDLPIANPRDLRRLVSAYRSAKNRLVSSNMGLVYAVVRSKHGHRLRMAGISEDELVQEGSLGLLRAAELFDPDRYGARFSTYATTWIKGMLSNSRVDQAISVPARETTKWNKIRRAAADIAMESCGGEQQQPETNQQPKAKEVASRTGLNLAEVQHTTSKMAQVQKVLSLDYRYRTVRRSEVEDHTGFDHDRAVQVDADLAERITFRSDVVAALARNLSEEEGRLLRLRYGLDADGDADGSGGRSFAECDAIMGWSRDKARYLTNKCLQKLREADGAEALQEYLLTVA